jgi:hypothetical protein
MSVVAVPCYEMNILPGNICLHLLATVSALASESLEIRLVNSIKMFMNPGMLQSTHFELINKSLDELQYS